jgi:hypothetical protein
MYIATLLFSEGEKPSRSFPNMISISFGLLTTSLFFFFKWDIDEIKCINVSEPAGTREDMRKRLFQEEKMRG